MSLTGGTVTGDLSLVNSGFKIYNDAGNANPNFYKAQDATGGMGLGQNRARGTIAAPTALIDGDVVSGISALGHDGTAYINSGGFRFKVAGTVSTGVVPMKLVLETGEAASAFERLVVMPDGKIGIGTSTPTVELDVVGTIQGDGLIVQTTQGDISISNGVSGLDFASAGSSYIRATDAAGSLNIVTGANDFASVRLAINPTGVITNPNSSATSTDTTADRLLKVGDFGLGELSTVEYPKTDIDAVTCPSGMYRLTNVNPSAGTRPAGHSAYGYIQVLSYGLSEKFQIATDINGKVASRSLKPSGNTDWVDHYTSGNSVNPLDYGLGDFNTNDINADALGLATGMYRALSTGTPDNAYYHMWHNSRVEDAQSAQILVRDGSESQMSMFFRQRASTGAWSPYAEVFHSKNSVNPLDYGLKTATLLTVTDNLDNFLETGFWMNSTAGNTAGNNYPVSSAGSLQVIGYNATLVTQTYIRYAAGAASASWFRSKGTAGWSDWAEIFTSTNSINPAESGLGVVGNDSRADGKLSSTVNFADVPVKNMNISWGSSSSPPSDGALIGASAGYRLSSSSERYSDFTIQNQGANGSASMRVSFKSHDGVNSSDWFDFYHSGNSVNPLDYGLGGQAILTENFDTIALTGFYRNSSGSAVGAPFSGSLFTISHIQTGSNSATQTAVDSYTTTTNERCFTRSLGSTGWQPWVEMYTSGNSVNPLDYGIGTSGGPISPDLDDNTLGGGLYAVVNGITANNTVGDMPAFSGHLIQYGRSGAARVQQLAMSEGSPTMHYRNYNSGRVGNQWNAWTEVYDSGNTNFNKVGGDGVFANDYLVRGYAYSATGAVFFVPLNNVDTMPSSLTVLANSAFKVTNALGTSTGTVPSAATYPQIAFDPLSTQRQLVFIITSLSGMTVGEPLNLRATATSSGFTYA